MNRISRRTVLVSIILIMITAASVTAGTTGYISGRITNESGYSLWVATVLITGTRLGAMTGSDGIYCITDVEPGVYELRASIIGWGSQTAEEVIVSSNDTTFVDFSLKVFAGCLAIITTQPEVTDSIDIKGCIAGSVTDESGKPLYGATVVILGTRLGAITEEGVYCITDIDPGIYGLVANFVGMCQETVEEVIVSSDDTTFVNITLEEYHGSNVFISLPSENTDSIEMLGCIAGLVTDEHGEPLQGATVMIEETSLGTMVMRMVSI